MNGNDKMRGFFLEDLYPFLNVRIERDSLLTTVTTVSAYSTYVVFYCFICFFSPFSKRHWIQSATQIYDYDFYCKLYGIV